MSDARVLMGIVVFLGTFIFLQAQFSTSAIEVNSGWNYTYANSTQIGITQGSINAPPTCTPVVSDAKSVLDMILPSNTTETSGFCTADWLGWFLSLMYFKSTINWLNTLIILPLVIVLTYLLFSFARGI